MFSSLWGTQTPTKEHDRGAEEFKEDPKSTPPVPGDGDWTSVDVPAKQESDGSVVVVKHEDGVEEDEIAAGRSSSVAGRDSVQDQRQDEDRLSVAGATLAKQQGSILDNLDSSPSATPTDDDDDEDEDSTLESTEGVDDADPYNDIPPATSSQLSQLDDSDIDMELVEQYDAAFNEFVGQNPEFLINNADLVHSLRVAKLQKILEKQDSMEAELARQLEHVRARKNEMVSFYQNQLKEAARKKAAREIHLQKNLSDVQKTTRHMEVNLMWELVALSERRAKESFHLQQHKMAPLDREGLLELLPAHYFDSIRDAALAPPSRQPMTSSQETDLRQFQVDNAFLMAEVTVLQKKLAYQTIVAKKNAWVESVLCRLDRLTMKKLKLKYQRKTGVKI